jgi:hypothetical protein
MAVCREICRKSFFIHFGKHDKSIPYFRWLLAKISDNLGVVAFAFSDKQTSIPSQPWQILVAERRSAVSEERNCRYMLQKYFQKNQ